MKYFLNGNVCILYIYMSIRYDNHYEFINTRLDHEK